MRTGPADVEKRRQRSGRGGEGLARAWSRCHGEPCVRTPHRRVGPTLLSSHPPTTPPTPPTPQTNVDEPDDDAILDALMADDSDALDALTAADAAQAAVSGLLRWGGSCAGRLAGTQGASVRACVCESECKERVTKPWWRWKEGHAKKPTPPSSGLRL